MPKLSDTAVPSYRLHKQSGQAICTLNGRDICLGIHGTPETKARYDRLIAEWIASGRQLPRPEQERTVSEILAAYWQHAQQYYRRSDGTQTEEIKCIKKALGPLRHLYGAAPAASFGPLALKAVREEMVRMGWCRTYVNAQVGRVRRSFKWAAENELVPASVYHGLTAVMDSKLAAQ